MDYRFISGYREGSILLHVLSENRLYVEKIERNGIKEYVCYQTILSTPKKKTSGDQQKCTARVRIHPDGTLEKMNVPHTRHDNHDAVILKCEQINNMKQKCKTLRDDYPEDGHNVPAIHIYQREISE